MFDKPTTPRRALDVVEVLPKGQNKVRGHEFTGMGRNHSEIMELLTRMIAKYKYENNIPQHEYSVLTQEIVGELVERRVVSHWFRWMFIQNAQVLADEVHTLQANKLHIIRVFPA